MSSFEGLPVRPPLPPMEARSVDSLPDDKGWQFEPKWDGFRCLVFRDGASVALLSKAGRELARYFPEIETAIRAARPRKFVVDGELTISLGGRLSFEALQMRLHPAASRVRRLAAETPARLVLFDCLVAAGRALIDRPLEARRPALERLHAQIGQESVLISPCTLDRARARSWLESTGGALDGVVAKRRDGAYLPGERAMLKVKLRRTADCVVGGFRYGAGSDEVGSLLLGLYDDDGALDHVGFTSNIPAGERAALTRRLERLVAPPGFTGRAPGGPSRWSRGRSADWEPLRPEIVVEVAYDHVSGDRFRHGASFVRWRPDKAPTQCRMDQLSAPAAPADMAAVLAPGR